MEIWSLAMVPPGLGIVSFSSLGFIGFFAAVTALYLTASAAMVISSTKSGAVQRDTQEFAGLEDDYLGWKRRTSRESRRPEGRMAFLVNTNTSWDEPPRCRYQVTNELAKSHRVFFIERNKVGTPCFELVTEQSSLVRITPYWPSFHT